MENQFGKVSSLRLTAAEKDGKTVLEELYFTAPFKVMSPFEGKQGDIRVMLLSASAGIMAGDTQEFQFLIRPGASLEFLSQSYEKIHKMQGGSARRISRAEVAAHGSFSYRPQPVIPYRDSDFDSQMEVLLADESARFAYREILSCGRSARGERFEYRRFHSLVQIRRGGRLIYRDNTRYEPQKMDMQGLGMLEGYTHQANLVYCGYGKDADWADAVRALLATDADAQGGVTMLMSGDYAVRLLGYQGQQLEELCERIDRL